MEYFDEYHLIKKKKFIFYFYEYHMQYGIAYNYLFMRLFCLVNAVLAYIIISYVV